MKINEHLEKAAAFERALAKLDPREDGELYVVFSMRAGTNRVNAALHALGITAETTGPACGIVGDLNHTYKPRLDAPLPQNMQQVFKRLAFIEDLRAEYVRGPKPLGGETAGACHAAYAEIRRETQRILGEDPR